MSSDRNIDIKILLDNKDFQKNIKKSIKQLKETGDESKKASKGVSKFKNCF